jgi:hypothetical protein
MVLSRSALPEALFYLVHTNIADCHHRQRFIESQDIPETENTLGLDGGEAKFYVHIQSTTMERPDLERTMEQNTVLFIHWRQAGDYCIGEGNTLYDLRKIFVRGFSYFSL